MVALAVIVIFQIPTPITLQLTQFKDALFTLNFDKITASMVALIVGLGTATGIAGALAYAYNQAKKGLATVTTQLSSTKQQVQTLYNQNDLIAKEKAELQENSNTVIKQISTEKEAAVNQAKEYEAQLQTTTQKIHDQEVSLQTLSQQKVAEFTSKLPTDSVITDPVTGHVIKTVSQIIVK